MSHVLSYNDKFWISLPWIDKVQSVSIHSFQEGVGACDRYKQAPKQWNQKFDGVVLSNGYYLTKSTKLTNVDLTKEFLSSRFSMKDMREANVIFGIRIKHGSNGIIISQSHYIEKVLKKFNYFDCPVSTPMDTSEKLMPNNVGKLSRYTSNPGTQHWQAIQRVLKYLKKTMDYRLTYTGLSFSVGRIKLALLVIKGIYICALAVPAPISIRCDSAATLAKAYSQMYNGKSRHLGVRHSMIRELITNGVISIEFVRSQQNLVDHLTKGLTRDLVIKSAEGK
ncbi:zinc finger, CCHC-type containing protein [Tanacetum coccineum]